MSHRVNTLCRRRSRPGRCKGFKTWFQKTKTWNGVRAQRRISARSLSSVRCPTAIQNLALLQSSRALTYPQIETLQAEDAFPTNKKCRHTAALYPAVNPTILWRYQRIQSGSRGVDKEIRLVVWATQLQCSNSNLGCTADVSDCIACSCVSVMPCTPLVLAPSQDEEFFIHARS